MAVSIQTGPAFVAGSPALVFEAPYSAGFGGRAYDVTPDGRRFLMVKEGADVDSLDTSRNRFIIVENWFEELRQRVPVP